VLGAAAIRDEPRHHRKVKPRRRPGRLVASDGVGEAQQVDQRRPRIDRPDGRWTLQSSRHPARGLHEAPAWIVHLSSSADRRWRPGSAPRRKYRLHVEGPLRSPGGLGENRVAQNIEPGETPRPWPILRVQ
jgi:hypothetical protein